MTAAPSACSCRPCHRDHGAAPFWAAPFTITLLNYIGIYALVVLGVVLLTGVGGLTSFGQAAFVGIGAYATAWLTTAQGASPWLGLVFALALTGMVAALSSAPSRCGSADISCRSAPSPGVCRSIFCSAIWSARPPQRHHRRAADRIGSISLEPTARSII
jgi:hypothetical protein